METKKYIITNVKKKKLNENEGASERVTFQIKVTEKLNWFSLS